MTAENRLQDFCNVCGEQGIERDGLCPTCYDTYLYDEHVDHLIDEAFDREYLDA